MSNLSWLDIKNLWNGLETILMVISRRTIGEKVPEEKRYCISSLKGELKHFGKFIRSHWGIESYHWVLDETFAEDDSNVDIEYTAENLAVFKRLGLNILLSLFLVCLGLWSITGGIANVNWGEFLSLVSAISLAFYIL